jgi:hypothetical protein
MDPGFTAVEKARPVAPAAGALGAPAIGSLPPSRLRTLLAAGAEALECQRVLRKGGINLVSEVLRGQGTFYEYDHYPADDVYDPDTGAQYYYHAHRGGGGEHGHFHTFIRNPAAVLGTPPRFPPEDGEHHGDTAHLIAIAMDAYGWPIGLFATNRWVTGESWYSAHRVLQLIDRFRFGHAYPSWPVNRWIGAMVVLFRPHIETLLHHRDAVIDACFHAHPGRNVLEDRELEVTGYLPISVEETVEAVRHALHR